MANTKKLYTITNAAEDIFEKKYELSEREYKFLDKLFKDMNKSSEYLYVGNLSIKEVTK